MARTVSVTKGVKGSLKFETLPKTQEHQSLDYLREALRGVVWGDFCPTSSVAKNGVLFHARVGHHMGRETLAIIAEGKFVVLKLVFDPIMMTVNSRVLDVNRLDSSGPRNIADYDFGLHNRAALHCQGRNLEKSDLVLEP